MATLLNNTLSNYIAEKAVNSTELIMSSGMDLAQYAWEPISKVSIRNIFASDVSRNTSFLLHTTNRALVAIPNFVGRTHAATSCVYHGIDTCLAIAKKNKACAVMSAAGACLDVAGWATGTSRYTFAVSTAIKVVARVALKGGAYNLLRCC